MNTPIGERPLIIGIAGGIGSGKSTVARALADAGCVIYDADEQVSLLYERDDVLETIRAWWGDDVAPDGEGIDRARIAQIVFEDPSQRERLEGLLFPLLAESRAAIQARAETEGRPAVVVDAPLLYEAGLDEGCDAVVFVDTPRAERLRRLGERSGWDEPELDRREKAQMPLDAKRSRADYTLSGEGSEAEVGQRARQLLESMLRLHRG